MKKTVICNFVDEEYYLPWFLNHHKDIFDHGIMVDYWSTDRSVDIIKEICPTWDIVKPKATYSDPALIDQEVMDIESTIDGWKICLNVTEQLIGDYSILDRTDKNQLLLREFVFVDDNPKVLVNHSIPLYQQKFKGLSKDASFKFRQARSIHRTNIKYTVGRHFDGEVCDDLVIFYYGFCPFNEHNIKRRAGICKHAPKELDSHNSKMIGYRNSSYPHFHTDRYKRMVFKSVDLKKEIDYYQGLHRYALSKKKS